MNLNVTCKSNYEQAVLDTQSSVCTRDQWTNLDDRNVLDV